MIAVYPYLSIVVPAYNEEKRLPDTLTRIFNYLERQDYSWEVIVVDDGSEDNTSKIVEDFQRDYPALFLVRNPHQGKAYTVRTGILKARGKYVFHCDADLSVPIEELGKFLLPLESGYDIAIGSRVKRYDMPWYRHVMAWGFLVVVRLLALRGLRDTQCGFKGYRNEVAKDLFSRARLYSSVTGTVKGAVVTGFDVEILFLAVKRSYKIKEIPVEWYYSASSKVNPIMDSLRNFLDVLRVRWNDLRGKYEERESV